MNNQDKVAQLQRIISTAQNNLALLMKKGGRFKPEINKRWFVVNTKLEVGFFYSDGSLFDRACYENFNCYETEELATKAAVMMKRSNAIIMACLIVDPDFVPDYLSGNQRHYSFEYKNSEMGCEERWNFFQSFIVNSGPSVSTKEKWEEAAALLTEWGVE
jgi:hypothetical protein